MNSLSPLMQSFLEIKQRVTTKISSKISEYTLNPKQTIISKETKETQEFPLSDEELFTDFVIIEAVNKEPLTVDEWKDILEGKTEPEYEKLYVSLQHGIPQQLRRRIWRYLAHVDDLKKEYSEASYEQLKERDCRHKEMIKKDVRRTFPEVELFQKSENMGTEMLYNLLKTYANFDTEIGYTQGMNYLAATLIYHMNPEKIAKDYNVIDKQLESDAFWIMVHILKKKGWTEVYKDGTPGLMKMLQELENRIRKTLPRLTNVLDETTILACFSQCFLTVLCYHSPKCFSKRLFDLFLLVGEEIIYDIVIKLLALCEEEILKMNNAPERLYKFLRSELVKSSYKKLTDFTKLTKDVDDL